MCLSPAGGRTPWVGWRHRNRLRCSSAPRARGWSRQMRSGGRALGRLAAPRERASSGLVTCQLLPFAYFPPLPLAKRQVPLGRPLAPQGRAPPRSPGAGHHLPRARGREREAESQPSWHPAGRWFPRGTAHRSRAQPLPCPGGGLRLTGRVAGSSPTWFPRMRVKGARGAQMSTGPRWLTPTPNPKGPQTRGQHVTGPSRLIWMPEPKVNPRGWGAKLTAIRSLWGSPSPSPGPMRAETLPAFHAHQPPAQPPHPTCAASLPRPPPGGEDPAAAVLTARSVAPRARSLHLPPGSRAPRAAVPATNPERQPAPCALPTGECPKPSATRSASRGALCRRLRLPEPHLAWPGQASPRAPASTRDPLRPVGEAGTCAGGDSSA